MRILLMEKGLSLFLQALGEIVEYLCAHRSLSGPLYQSRAWCPPIRVGLAHCCPPIGAGLPSWCPPFGGDLTAGLDQTWYPGTWTPTGFSTFRYFFLDFLVIVTHIVHTRESGMTCNVRAWSMSRHDAHLSCGSF